MKKVGESTRNITWQKNQALIQDAYIRLIKNLRRCPTQLEVCSEVNLSMKAVENHVKELKFEPLKDLMRTLTPDVVMAIANSAMKGSSASQKLWMQIMEGWTESHNIDLSSLGERITGFNYIPPQSKNGNPDSKTNDQTTPRLPEVTGQDN